MTTTSLLPHKPTTRNNVPFRSSHYGSMGRPTSGRRKSAVELLQETKAFYVKSESVLDTKQELRNTDHLHVKSPTVDVVANHYRSLPGNPSGTIIPFFPIGTCPPYPHHHYERYEHIQFKFENVLHPQQQQLQQQFGTNDRKRIYDVPREMTSRSFALAPTSHKNRSGKSNARSATLPSGHSSGKRHKDLRGLSSSGKSKQLGMTISYTTDQDIPGLLRLGPQNNLLGPQKNLATATLPSSAKISHVPENIPPPLPPRSPKTTKPPRPHDFPQRLPVQGMVSTAAAAPAPHPLTAPRRLLSHESDHGHNNDGNIQSKLRRLLHDAGRSLVPVPPVVSSDINVVPIITLPSPILPPTPPPDVTLESPMSDSGPIISPPPAFSTPVTPMLDRQNSSASEKSSQRHEPLSAAMSMVSISSVSSPNSRKSIPSLSDMSVNNHHCSPPAYSSSSVMSPEDVAGDEGDDDSSQNISLSDVKINIRNGNLMKKTPIPKSVTENTLCKTNNVNSPDPRVTPQASEASPVRRPILRSKSDLSHRYIKSSNSATLLGGGLTLVHVDLGLPPPPPPHQNNLFSYPDRMEDDVFDKKRCSISSLELERFFDKLGLENSTPPPTSSGGVNNGAGGNNSAGSSPVFFSSVSSVDSGPRRCGSVDSGDSPVGIKIGSRTVGGGGYNAPAATTSGSSILVKHGEPSIVERNARVIKWLFNCRKAVNKR